LPLPLRLALRDLRGGLTGLRLLAVCLFLGVAALAAVGSLSAALVAGLAERGQSILGGDVQLTVAQREASAEELAAFRREGRLSHVTRMRAMAARLDGTESILVELKGVDEQYPLFGSFRLQPGALAARLQAIRWRSARTRRAPARPRRRSDPHRQCGASRHGADRRRTGPGRPGLHIGLDCTRRPHRPRRDRLVQPGSLYNSAYRLVLPAGADLAATSKRLASQFKDSGYEVQDRSNGAPGTRRFIERLGQFLTLVGLTALVVAGIGVGNGVASYLDGKRGTIATLKLLGATSRTIFISYLLQIGLVALAAIVAGLAVGTAAPSLVVWIAGSALPVPPRLAIYPLPLLVSAIYGLLIAVVFALSPLARARTVPAASLFRGSLEAFRRPPVGILLAVLAAGRPDRFAGHIHRARAHFCRRLHRLGTGPAASAHDSRDGDQMDRLQIAAPG
jgi:putative ABC transport system permease protein